MPFLKHPLHNDPLPELFVSELQVQQSVDIPLDLGQ